MPTIADQALSLPPVERLRLIDQIWRSLSAHPEQIPISDAVLDELNRRRDRYRNDPTSLQDWDRLKDEISEERGKTN